MSIKNKYRKKKDNTVIAVQLDIDTEGFSYYKWGATQFCKPGDWLVNNSGDIYTIDRETFNKTYVEVSPGNYSKTTHVWAEVADESGFIKTFEGETAYQPGDYLVFNDEEGKDAYAVSRVKFEAMYELLE